ncbi:PEP-CTERM sorting domain-containing protein [Colwellia sp. Arc7-635]|uniref:PEP-CTERM sorting domain-containing protein n=1 Tax=Colwellia sp. Arc7-635 TaxID=2497879 RepID=UPI000F857AD1|nr:PEP-CTERM sorting domain-containing protein [Colwellia sp. Arc7-635]AZQ85334.1 PEP-CTERM sorting domain-containing protein [Colwellia sp. Arc7-635]
MNIKMLKSAVAGLVLSVSGFANAGLIPFAITDIGHVAERLNYGAGAIDVNGPARITTDYANTLSDNWFQEVYMDGQSLSYSIEWKFSNNLSMKDRFTEAVTVGSSVQWLINSNGTESIINGTWWWSDSSKQNNFDWTTSGSSFSDDDGIWGAGLIVNGDSGSGIRSNNTTWGVGNYNSGDTSQRVWTNNVTTSGVTDLKNIMYIKTTEVPEPTTLAIFALGILGLASRRFKKQ